MDEELRKNIVDETVLARGDSLYTAGPAARQDLSSRLTAEGKDIDLTAVDVFSQATSFLPNDTNEVQLRKLQEFREFCVGLGHKVIKLTSANFSHFQQIEPLQDRITEFTDRLAGFGLDAESTKIEEIESGIQSLVEDDQALRERYQNLKDLVLSHDETLEKIGTLKDFVDSIKKAAYYSKHMKLMYEQAGRLEGIEENRREILSLVADMPANQLKSAQTDSDIQQLKNQNSLLNDEVKRLKNDLATRPTLAIVKQEINKYSTGGRITGSSTPTGLQNLPKLEKIDPKLFRAFRTQFKHYSAIANWTPDQEALHLPLALNQSISQELLRCVPHFRTMTTDEIFQAWSERICPTSVRDVAISQLSKLQQKMSEENSAYLNRAENLYIDSQDPESNPDPNTDTNFIQLVTNGIKDFTIRRLVRDKRSKTFNELRDNWRRAVADYEIDQGMGDIDTQSISEIKNNDTQKQPKVLSCYTCQSTSHRYKECPKAMSLVKELVAKELKKKSKFGKGGGKKWQGGQGGKKGKKGSAPNNSEKFVKQEPKN